MTVTWSFARNPALNTMVSPFSSPRDCPFLGLERARAHSLTILPLAWVDPTKTSALQSLLFFFSPIKDLNY